MSSNMFSRTVWMVHNVCSTCCSKTDQVIGQCWHLKKVDCQVGNFSVISDQSKAVSCCELPMIHVEVDPAVDCAVQCHLRKLIAECPTHFSPLTTAHGAKAFLVANFRDCLSCSRIQLLIVCWCYFKEVDSRSVPPIPFPALSRSH